MSTIAAWETELREVASGVYAYIQAGSIETSNTSIANAGVIVGEHGVIVIDTLSAPVQTRPFIAAIRTVTDLPVTHVINTHHHLDHTFGNCFFAPAEIIGHHYCRAETIEVGLALELVSQPELRDGLDELRLAPATTTFGDALTCHQGGREIRIVHLGAAHTPGDALVYLPAERVLFAGDVAFHSVTPQAMGGTVRGWLAVLEKLGSFELETVVPGHGPVGTTRELAEMRDYLVLVQSAACERFDAGLGVIDAALEIDLGPYARWANPERIAGNVLRVHSEWRGDPPETLSMADGIASAREFLRRRATGAEPPGG